MWHIWGSNLFMFPQIQSQLRNYKITVGKNFQMGKKKIDILLVVAASELALPCLNRLSQWYYMWRSTWSLPEGFQRLDHPKAAVLHKDSPFIHSFVSSVFHRMTVKFVLFVRPRWVQPLKWLTGMPLWTGPIGPLDDHNWRLRFRVVECLTIPLSLLKIGDFHLRGQFVTLPAHTNKTKIRNKTRHMQASWSGLRRRSVSLHCTSTGESFVPYCLPFPPTMLHLICPAREVTAYLIDRALTSRNIQITWGPAGVRG